MSNSGSGPAIKMPDWSSMNFDFDKLSPNYDDDSEGVDYIPYNKKGRDLTGSLFFNTGILWIAGMSFGGVYGASQGYRNRTNTSLKMTVNGIMNGWTKYGSKSANTLSVLAVYHTSISYFLDEVVHLDNYIKNSYKLITPLISGSLTGLIFFTPRTVPAATVAALGGATLSYAYNYVKNINFSSKR